MVVEWVLGSIWIRIEVVEGDLLGWRMQEMEEKSSKREKAFDKTRVD
jgi:hypothetical protein